MAYMHDSHTSPALADTIVYRPYAFNPPANPMGNKMNVDFGNPTFDRRVFQIDATYSRYIQNYDAVRRSGHLGDYVAEDRLDESAQTAVVRFMVTTLVAEYPDQFTCREESDGYHFENRLLGESVQFDRGYRYVGGGRFTYRNGIDALASQIPEDIAVVLVEDDRDRLAAVHVVAPSGWNPRAKLGGSFVEIHHPIHHHRSWFEKVQAGVRNIAKSDQTLQRFGWSITNDANLDHHPDHGGEVGAARIQGDRDVFVRVERQILKGFPEVGALLFTIRVYVERCRDLPLSDRTALRTAIAAMGPEERAYKGVAANFDRIIEQLENPPATTDR